VRSIEFRVDDLSGEAIQALVARHLRGMHENSPPESVHAFDLSRLKQPGVTFWSAWIGDEVVGMGALKRIDEANGEIKSMRVSDPWLGKGVGRALLEHIVGQARQAGLKRLWLETGSAAAFAPAPPSLARRRLQSPARRLRRAAEYRGTRGAESWLKCRAGARAWLPASRSLDRCR
jgi:putative acetyltransferase